MLLLRVWLVSASALATLFLKIMKASLSVSHRNMLASVLRKSSYTLLVKVAA
jgi:hypothetical protein